MSRVRDTRAEDEDETGRTVPLGDVQPAGSRHRGRRSAVAFAGDVLAVGRADGSVVAFDPETLAERWTTDGEGSAVTLAALGAGDGERDGAAVVVGERSARGAVRVLDADTGAERWRYDTAADVGAPQRDTRFFLPFVVDAVAPPTAEGDASPDPDAGLYVAARRYERSDGGRAFRSVVYAFDPDGTERWRYATDASPISLDLRGDRLAVAYNRCPGDHRDGLVVLAAGTGAERWRWDPPADGERRVGDVSLRDGDTGAGLGADAGTASDAGSAVVTSHADYRGYALDAGGEVRWSVDLATPIERDGDTVYAYPNHVHATADGAVFVTGNTYPEEGRETDARHPLEHTAVGYAGGERRWSDPVGGFANAVATDGPDGPTVAVPCAQNFRERDAAIHSLRLFDVRGGHRRTVAAEGVVAAAALAPDRAAAVEEPVRYHDEGTERGAYRLHVLDR